MTDQDRSELEKDVLWKCEKSREEVAALSVKIELIVDGFEHVLSGLRTHPELLTPTPALNAPDYREDFKAVDLKIMFDTCRELAQAKEKLRQAEKRRDKLRFGTNQTRIDI